MGSRRIGLQRTLALIEDLKRSIDWNGATLTDVKIETGQNTTLAGTNTLSGNNSLTGDTQVNAKLTHLNGTDKYVVGMKNVVRKEVAFTGSSATIASGAFNLPGGSLITDVHIMVVQDATFPSGNLSLKGGDAAGEDDVIASINWVGSATSASYGKGTSTDAIIKTAMDGDALIVLHQSQAITRFENDAELHLTVTSSGGAFTAGKIAFIVEFIAPAS